MNTPNTDTVHAPTDATDALAVNVSRQGSQSTQQHLVAGAECLQEGSFDIAFDPQSFSR
jgi:hypothetical protein